MFNINIVMLNIASTVFYIRIWKDVPLIIDGSSSMVMKRVHCETLIFYFASELHIL